MLAAHIGGSVKREIYQSIWSQSQVQ